MRRFVFVIHGLVQGVFFRASTVDEANRLGITGYAENLPEGSVKVVAEGEVEDLKRLEEFLRSGPEGSEVYKVEKDEEDYKGEFKSFTVRY